MRPDLPNNNAEGGVDGNKETTSDRTSECVKPIKCVAWGYSPQSTLFGKSSIPWSRPLNGLNSLWGNKNWAPQNEGYKVGKVFWQNKLNRLRMVQFECPRHSIPGVLSISGEFSFLIINPSSPNETKRQNQATFFEHWTKNTQNIHMCIIFCLAGKCIKERYKFVWRAKYLT